MPELVVDPQERRGHKVKPAQKSGDERNEANPLDGCAALLGETRKQKKAKGCDAAR